MKYQSEKYFAVFIADATFMYVTIFMTLC